MSANRKRLICLAFSVLLSIIVGLVWGLMLYAMDEPGVECVKAGGTAFGGSIMVGLAVIMLFPFKDDGGAGTTAQAPVENRPGTPAP
ncbi:hypothetical protein [Streptomyces lanatus]|uniref:Uncharacterized protein n=1 Tax=Streptomyces lanatus TaxID=66900 RepID=A0ABV1XLL2_9ACTN|nr:hypothetical protein [Streptomyces lanatus]GHG99131.1 hypothetical protein GCM10018780_25600 [Streptomyces lanatus]